MQESIIIQELFDKKILNILNVFFDDKENEFYLREIAKLGGVAPATTFRIINKLLKLGIIDVIKIKKIKLYKLSDNIYTAYLETFLKNKKRAMDVIIDKLKEINNINQIILHGKETDSKANLLLIGSNIDDAKVKSIVIDAKEQHNFILSCLTLSYEQYDNMVSMGLYSGTKKVLYQN